ncbi:MAG: hypothetical protein AAB229_04530 [Candidatus Hydrogenedentota bacterium]
MHEFSGKLILILVFLAFVAGALVVTFDSSYTIEENVESNKDYYPSVKVDTGNGH